MAGFAALHPRAFNSRKEATQTRSFSFVLEGGLDVAAALIPTGDGGHGTAWGSQCEIWSPDLERRGPGTANRCDVNFQQLKHSEIR